MTDKGKGISPLDALLLLIADLVLIAAMVAAVIASEYEFLKKRLEELG